MPVDAPPPSVSNAPAAPAPRSRAWFKWPALVLANIVFESLLAVDMFPYATTRLAIAVCGCLAAFVMDRIEAAFAARLGVDGPRGLILAAVLHIPAQVITAIPVGLMAMYLAPPVGTPLPLPSGDAMAPSELTARLDALVLTPVCALLDIATVVLVGFVLSSMLMAARRLGSDRP